MDGFAPGAGDGGGVFADGYGDDEALFPAGGGEAFELDG